MPRGVIGSGASTRASRSRCVACNHRQVEVYLCERCARGSAFIRRDDPRAPTATTISKAMTAAAARATEVDHLSVIRSIRDLGSLDSYELDSDGESLRSPYDKWTAHALYHNHLPHFTSKELRRWGEILDELAPIRGSMARTIARQRSRAARRRWTKFCEFWSLLGLRIFTASLSPPTPRRRKLSKELLARIEESDR